MLINYYLKNVILVIEKKYYWIYNERCYYWSNNIKYVVTEFIPVMK